MGQFQLMPNKITTKNARKWPLNYKDPRSASLKEREQKSVCILLLGSAVCPKADPFSYMIILNFTAD